MDTNVDQTPVESNSEASSTEPKQDNTVSYDSFRKSVEAEKKARTKAQELEAQLEAMRNAELEKQGNHQEVIENLKAKTMTLEQQLKEQREGALWEKVTGTLKTEALKSGCIDPDKLIKLFNKDDFETLKAENGTIMQDSVSALMEKAKKENFFLFSKGEVKINDMTPSRSQNNKVSTSEMTPRELEEYIKANF